MTPVSTDTPKSARKPTPEETLKCVPVASKREQPADGSNGNVGENQASPFGRTEHGVKNDEDDEDRDGQDDHQALLRSFLAFVLAGPIDVIADRKFDTSCTTFMASSTVLPRSRPRTLYLMAT